MAALKDILFCLLLAGASVALGKDGRRSDDNGALGLLQQQAQAIARLEAKMSAMEAEHLTSTQALNQKIQQLEQALGEVKTQLPAITDVKASLQHLLTATYVFAYYLAYRLTVDTGAKSAFQKMPNSTQLLQEIFPIRLVDGTSAMEGRLEIKIGNSWGTSCDDGVTDNFASVACQQLGYPRAHATQVNAAKFGQGTGFIFLDDMVCTGSENHILLCPSNQMLHANCVHSEDVGVLCLP